MEEADGLPKFMGEMNAKALLSSSPTKKKNMLIVTAKGIELHDNEIQQRARNEIQQHGCV